MELSEARIIHSYFEFICSINSSHNPFFTSVSDIVKSCHQALFTLFIPISFLNSTYPYHTFNMNQPIPSPSANSFLFSFYMIKQAPLMLLSISLPLFSFLFPGQEQGSLAETSSQMGQIVCYHYCQPGHRRRDCPQRQGSRGSAG